MLLIHDRIEQVVRGGPTAPPPLAATLRRMSLPQDAHLVTVTDGGRPRDGIIFDRLSPTKLVVAVMDRRRGPVFRTLAPSALSPRVEPSDDDVSLRRLIRRTPPPAGRRHGNSSAGQAARAAHTRGAAHRSTGR